MGGHTVAFESQAWKPHPALVHKFEALDVSLKTRQEVQALINLQIHKRVKCWAVLSICLCVCVCVQCQKYQNYHLFLKTFFYLFKCFVLNWLEKHEEFALCRHILQASSKTSQGCYTTSHLAHIYFLLSIINKSIL